MTSGVRAVLFDIFGTVVDWRTGVRSAIDEFAGSIGTSLDSALFADSWRSRYQPSMERIRSGERTFVTLDTLHRENLDAVLEEIRVDTQQIEDRRLIALARSWRRLPPWPDSAPGLRSLREQFIVGPLSNANTSLLVALSRYGDLSWDVVLGADITRAYKPDPAAYSRFVALLELDPEDVMLAAAHNDDLAAAQQAGMATAFIPRPTEYGPGQSIDLKPNGDWDVIATDILDLARQMSALR